MKNARKTNPELIGILVILGMMVFAACSNNYQAPILGPANSQSSSLTKKTGLTQNNSTLLLVRVRQDQENGVSSATIGPDGGVLDHAEHQVEVLAGALNATVELSFSMPVSDTLMFDLKPDGIQFNPNFPVNLIFSYDHAVMEGVDAESLIIVVWNPATKTWDAIPSSVDTETNEVTGQTKHFSRYAISKG